MGRHSYRLAARAAISAGFVLFAGMMVSGRTPAKAAPDAVAGATPRDGSPAGTMPQGMADSATSPGLVRAAEMKRIEGPAAYFDGKATIIGPFTRPAPSRVGGAIVRFEPGARTAWHSHPAGQTLIVTQGEGWTQVEGEPKRVIRAGDILWCPPGKRHWHGATAHTAMTHVAIQETVDGSAVKWMEKVSDGTYLAPADRR